MSNRLTITVELERDDGLHTRVLIVGNPPTKEDAEADPVGTLIGAAMVGSEIVDSVVTLIGHECEGKDGDGEAVMHNLFSRN